MIFASLPLRPASPNLKSPFNIRIFRLHNFNKTATAKIHSRMRKSARLIRRISRPKRIPMRPLRARRPRSCPGKRARATVKMVGEEHNAATHLSSFHYLPLTTADTTSCNAPACPGDVRHGDTTDHGGQYHKSTPATGPLHPLIRLPFFSSAHHERRCLHATPAQYATGGCAQTSCDTLEV